MTTITCDHCESEIDVKDDPNCVVYEPSGATDVICETCRMKAYDNWLDATAPLREAYRIKRGWRA